MKVKRLSHAALLPVVISVLLIVATITFPARTDSFAQGPPRTETITGTSTIPVATSTNTPVTPSTATSPPGSATATEKTEPTKTPKPTDTPAPTDTDRPILAITPISTPTVLWTATPTTKPAQKLPTATSTSTLTPAAKAPPTATPTSTPTHTPATTPTPSSTPLPPTPTATSTTSPTPSVPKVTIVAPEGGAEITVGEVLTVEAKISDPAGVERVELWVDGKMVGVQSPALKGQTIMNALFSWIASSPGSHTLAIRALNMLGLENALNAVVVNAVGGEPKVTILNPADGEQLPAGLQIMVQAVAEDPGGVERGELWVNGVRVADWRSPEAKNSMDPIRAGFMQLTGQNNNNVDPIRAGFIQQPPQVAMSFPWVPSAAGSYTLEVRSFNSAVEQYRASDSVMVIVVSMAATPSMMGVSGGIFSLWWMPGLLLLTLLIAVRITQSRNP
jgi:hypothetical protein